MFGGSHESDFHNVTRYGSKMCHRSVTCVTCDTTRHGLWQCPPLGLSPQRPKTRKRGKGYTVITHHVGTASMWAFFEFDAFHTSEWPIIWTIRWATQLHAIYKVWWWSAEYFLSTMLIKHQLTCICIVLKLKLVFMTHGQLLTPQNDSHLIYINHNNY